MSPSDAERWPLGAPGELSDRLARGTEALVSVRSVYGSEGELADRVETWCREVFPSSQRLGNALIAGDLNDPRSAVALVGHLDTVPPPNGQFAEVRRNGDEIRGLGSTDMKGALAVMCALAEDLDLATLPVNLILVFYDKEEGPHLDSGLIPLVDVLPERLELAVCMEPTSNELQLGCVGGLHATVRIAGRAAHSARPWQGENAIHKGGALLYALSRRERTAVAVEGLTYYEVMSATLASGGRARTIVPDQFELNLNYRFAPGKSLEEAERELATFVGEHVDATIEITDRAPAGAVRRSNRLVKRLEADLGAAPTAKQAWTDVARLTEAGIDAVNFGPGDPDCAHQADERVSISALVRSYEVLRGWLETP